MADHLLLRMFHTSKRRVRARGLQERADDVVGRVPSRGGLSVFQSGREIFGLVLLLAIVGPYSTFPPTANASILCSRSKQFITIADAGSNLVLRLNLDGRCVLDKIFVRGRQVAAPTAGAYSGICVSNHWFTTQSNLPAPKVCLTRKSVTVTDICYGGGGIQVKETWTFIPQPNGIAWQITRQCLSGGKLDDTCFPAWDFLNMATWTGGLLDHGGVAWNKYLETPNATYATHATSVTLWNPQSDGCLRISADATRGRSEERGAWSEERRAWNVQRGVGDARSTLYAPRSTSCTALRFTHQPAGVHTVAFSVTADERQPKLELRRFHASRQDLWAPFPISPGEISATCLLEAPRYDEVCNLGSLAGLNGHSIRELLNTIARYGVVDRHLVGANGWRTGFICLHEQWFPEIGLALADPDYLANCAATFDYERDHALLPDGRVKARWWYVAGDAMPDTYDKLGFYEAQWGYLLDSQPCFVISVAELFDLTGDHAWLSGQKTACERALEYLLRRDANQNGLVEMMTDSHADKRGSDWIDIIWAAHENALVNAEMYYALTLWAQAEDLLGDAPSAARYRACAAKLKTSFNLSTAEGGFWDPQNQWYVYWRDKDGSIHGNNLVTPVNFAAIGYGLCDDPARRDAILQRIESVMQTEKLFFWPLSFLPYQPDEGHANNFPFPKYENGDIFLSWGELAVRAYAQSDPALALKYIRNVLQKYDADGLSFQRYQRLSQKGAGEDILAGNCMTIVGLYRDIYGVQPKHNRLYLEPHLTRELNRTELRYPLRNQSWLIDLDVSGCRLATDDFAIRTASPFAMNVSANSLEFFPGQHDSPALSVIRSRRAPVEIQIESWPANPAEPRRWLESCSTHRLTVRHVVADLQPLAAYKLTRNGHLLGSFRADADGHLEFRTSLAPSQPQRIELLAGQ